MHCFGGRAGGRDREERDHGLAPYGCSVTPGALPLPCTLPPPSPATGACFLLWELSTPFMYIRWLMLKAGLAKSRGMMVANLVGALWVFCGSNAWGCMAHADQERGLLGGNLVGAMFVWNGCTWGEQAWRSCHCVH